jgi:hypothetical protein
MHGPPGRDRTLRGWSAADRTARRCHDRRGDRVDRSRGDQPRGSARQRSNARAPVAGASVRLLVRCTGFGRAARCRTRAADAEGAVSDVGRSARTVRGVVKCVRSDASRRVRGLGRRRLRWGRRGRRHRPGRRQRTADHAGAVETRRRSGRDLAFPARRKRGLLRMHERFDRHACGEEQRSDEQSPTRPVPESVPPIHDSRIYANDNANATSISSMV